jgi:hypothetical protein
LLSEQVDEVSLAKQASGSSVAAPSSGMPLLEQPLTDSMPDPQSSSFHLPPRILVKTAGEEKIAHGSLQNPSHPIHSHNQHSPFNDGVSKKEGQLAFEPEEDPFKLPKSSHAQSILDFPEPQKVSSPKTKRLWIYAAVMASSLAVLTSLGVVIYATQTEEAELDTSSFREPLATSHNRKQKNKSLSKKMASPLPQVQEPQPVQAQNKPIPSDSLMKVEPAIKKGVGPAAPEVPAGALSEPKPPNDQTKKRPTEPQPAVMGDANQINHEETSSKNPSTEKIRHKKKTKNVSPKPAPRGNVVKYKSSKETKKINIEGRKQKSISPLKKTVRPITKQNAPLGELIITSNPWARIYINGKSIGRNTPIIPSSPIKLAPGTYKITLEANKQRFPFTVKILPGKNKLMKTLPIKP